MECGNGAARSSVDLRQTHQSADPWPSQRLLTTSLGAGLVDSLSVVIVHPLQFGAALVRRPDSGAMALAFGHTGARNVNLGK